MVQRARHRVLDLARGKAGLLGLVDEALLAACLPGGEHDQVGLDVAVGVMGVRHILGEVVELCRADGADAAVLGAVVVLVGAHRATPLVRCRGVAGWCLEGGETG